jgi:hypothetical protein
MSLGILGITLLIECLLFPWAFPHLMEHLTGALKE